MDSRPQYRLVSSVLLLGLLYPTLAAAQVYKIGNPNPQSFSEIESEVQGGIPSNLNSAQCGGWDYDTTVKGVFDSQETLCYDAFDLGPGAWCRDKDGLYWQKLRDGNGNNRWVNNGNTRDDATMILESTIAAAEEGFISNVQNVPGRLNAALGNVRSGQGKRVEAGFDNGFLYPQDPATTCGFSTVCRTPSHNKRRVAPPIGPTFGRRDRPGFFCEHPCQRPLDGPHPTGKPANWDAENYNAVQCGNQQPYDPYQGSNSIGVKYACGGGETKPPDDNFCQELNDQGQLGGLCQDLNSWVYILWSKVVHVCWRIDVEERLDADGIPFNVNVCNPVPIWRNEKGPCGFPDEMNDKQRNISLCTDGYTASATNECCSDDAYGASVTVTPIEEEVVDDEGNPTGEMEIVDCNLGLTYDFNHIGNSCITCTGENCRDSGLSDQVIVPDVWFSPHPLDVQNQCLNVAADCDEVNFTGFPVNHGPWPNPPDPGYRYAVQDMEYISYFREYNDASYEREELELAADDDHKKEHIPVACYGMYDYHFGSSVTEDAKTAHTDIEHKRCTIAAYYDQDDGDGDPISWANMPDSQQGKGAYNNSHPDFPESPRPYNSDADIWYPRLGGAFSMIDNTVLEEQFDNDLSFALLAPDNAKHRATVQLDPRRRFSSGALMRAFDDTTTRNQDFTQERRTITQWWHMVATEMHEHFTPPTVRLLLPSTWTIDLDPLDPMYTKPPPDMRVSNNSDSQRLSIEVQIAAREDLLGDIVSFMERNLLLRVEEAPVQVVVPIGSPTEFRALAQGWDGWADIQEDKDDPPDGVAEARALADQLEEYAVRIEQVRQLRGELPRYAGELLEEQKVISRKLADWLQNNVSGYEAYLQLRRDTLDVYDFIWMWAQDINRYGHDTSQFPWCRNDRFTPPIYSLLDPWLPGRWSDGDTTGGFAAYAQCLAQLGNAVTDPAFVQSCVENSEDVPIGDCISAAAPSCGGETGPFNEYMACLGFVGGVSLQNPTAFKDFSACDGYFPVPPLLPFEQADREADIVVDFTAFREPQEVVQLPVLKPIQIRMDTNTVHPPGLDHDESITTIPVLDPLPEVPDSIAQFVASELPTLDIFQEAAIIKANSAGRGGPEDIPAIDIPELNILGIDNFLWQVQNIIQNMASEYRRFWRAQRQVPCDEDDPVAGCIEEGKEQDCLQPYWDPQGTCVHFEADLMERLQRISARPAVLLREDFESIGQFRDPVTHGQDYCEREDWACQLLNRLGFEQRWGWQLEYVREDDQESFINELRRQARETTDNVRRSSNDAEFLYDLPQREMYQNFELPQPFPLMQPADRHDPPPVTPDS